MAFKPQIKGLDYYEASVGGGSLTFTQPTSSPISMAQYDLVSVTHPAITSEKALFSVMVHVLGHDEIPTMTSNTVPSGTASASSVYGAAWAAWYAFNDIDDAGWATVAGTLTGWLAYEFLGNENIYSYRVKCQNHVNGPTAAPKTWTFDGWNGIGWDTLDTQTNITSWVATVWKEFTLASLAIYTKFRINITANNGQATYTAIGEMEINSIDHYESAVLGRDGDGHDFTISRVSSTVTALKRIMAGTSNVYFNVITP